MKSVLVLGRGFGLYGYVPALVSLGLDVFLPETSREVLSARRDLRSHLPRVEFVPVQEIPQFRSDGIVVARTPKLQERFVGSPELPTGIHLFLEKPLASCESAWDDVVSRATQSGRTFSVGYLFRYTEWYQSIVRTLAVTSGTVKVDIEWRLPQLTRNILAGNWKGLREQGGGPVPYYLIHFAPLFVDANLEVSGVRDLKFCGELQGSSEGRTDSVELSARVAAGSHSFSVKIWGHGLKEQQWRLDTPFGKVRASTASDTRIGVLSKYLLDIISDPGRRLERSISTESVARSLVSDRPATG